jgi:hypothetical protein
VFVWGMARLHVSLPACLCGVQKVEEVDLNYVLTKSVDKNYTFGNVKSTLKRNVFPVTLDGIKYDGVTKPPLVASNTAVRSAADMRDKMTKQVPGGRRCTCCLFKLWHQRLVREIFY